MASVSGMCYTAVITFSTAHATLNLRLVSSKVSIRCPESRVILIIVIIGQSDKHVTRINSFLLQVMPVQDAQDMGSASFKLRRWEAKCTRLLHRAHPG